MICGLLVATSTNLSSAQTVCENTIVSTELSDSRYLGEFTDQTESEVVGESTTGEPFQFTVSMRRAMSSSSLLSWGSDAADEMNESSGVSASYVIGSIDTGSGGVLVHGALIELPDGSVSIRVAGELTDESASTLDCLVREFSRVAGLQPSDPLLAGWGCWDEFCAWMAAAAAEEIAWLTMATVCAGCGGDCEACAAATMAALALMAEVSSKMGDYFECMGWQAE